MGVAVIIILPYSTVGSYVVIFLISSYSTVGVKPVKVALCVHAGVVGVLH